MNAKRTGALKHWFERCLEVRVGLTPVELWSLFWKRHIPTIINILINGTGTRSRVLEESAAADAYKEAYKALSKMSVGAQFLEQLKPDLASTGDNFEVAKFLVVILNEVRISAPNLLEQDYELSADENTHIAAILRHLDDPNSWDSYESWPAVLFQYASAPSSQPSTPKKPRQQQRDSATFSERILLKRSPLADVVSSPRTRELRMVREKDKKIKLLENRCRTLEYLKDEAEANTHAAVANSNRLVKQVDQLQNTLREQSKEVASLKLEADEWRSRAEDGRNEAIEARKDLVAAKSELINVKRQLREADFELSGRLKEMRDWEEYMQKKDSAHRQYEVEKEAYVQQLECERQAHLSRLDNNRVVIEEHEAENKELRSIIEALKAKLQQLREDYDEQAATSNEQVTEVAMLLTGKLQEKDDEIAKLKNSVSDLGIKEADNKRFRSETQKLLQELQVVREEFMSRKEELCDLRRYLEDIRIAYHEMAVELHSKDGEISSLRESEKLNSTRMRELMNSLEFQNQKYAEDISKIRNDYNSAQKTIHELNFWRSNLIDEVRDLRNEILKRDDACSKMKLHYEIQKEQFESAMSQRLSVCSLNRLEERRNSLIESSNLDDSTLTISLPATHHPLPRADDENDVLSSSSVGGTCFTISAPAPNYNSHTSLNTSVDSERLMELSRRNRTVPAHMRSSYATELMHYSVENLDLDALKSDDNLVQRRAKDADNMSAKSLSLKSAKKKSEDYLQYGSRRLRDIKQQFNRMLNSSPISLKKREPLQPSNWR